MHRYFLAILVAGLSASAIHSQSSPGSTAPQTQAEREVLAVDRQFDEALGHNDAAALERLVADDCIFTNDVGKVFGKEYRVNVTTSHKVVFTSYSADDVRVRIYGDTAVVTERNTTESQAREQSHSGGFRYTRVYVKQGSGWQLVAAQKTKIVAQ